MIEFWGSVAVNLFCSGFGLYGDFSIIYMCLVEKFSFLWAAACCTAWMFACSWLFFLPEVFLSAITPFLLRVGFVSSTYFIPVSKLESRLPCVFLSLLTLPFVSVVFWFDPPCFTYFRFICLYYLIYPAPGFVSIVLMGIPPGFSNDRSLLTTLAYIFRFSDLAAGIAFLALLFACDSTDWRKDECWPFYERCLC